MNVIQAKCLYIGIFIIPFRNKTSVLSKTLFECPNSKQILNVQNKYKFVFKFRPKNLKQLI